MKSALLTAIFLTFASQAQANSACYRYGFADAYTCYANDPTYERCDKTEQQAADYEAGYQAGLQKLAEEGVTCSRQEKRSCSL